MHNEFTAILEHDGDWVVAYSPKMPGANGQGKTRDEALATLATPLLSFSKTVVKTACAAFLETLNVPW